MTTLILFLFTLILFFINITTHNVRSGISMPWDLIKRIQKRLKQSEKSDVKSKYKSHLKGKLTSKAEDYQELFATMKLDHFSFDNSDTFKMRILINSKYYKEGGPILFYCGNEGPINEFWEATGFITNDLAKEFSGLVIYAEHRFFGKSFPKNQTKQDYDIKKNKYLTVEQTLTDFTTFLQGFMHEHKLPQAANIPP